MAARRPTTPRGNKPIKSPPKAPTAKPKKVAPRPANDSRKRANFEGVDELQRHNQRRRRAFGHK